MPQQAQHVRESASKGRLHAVFSRLPQANPQRLLKQSIPNLRNPFHSNRSVEINFIKDFVRSPLQAVQPDSTTKPSDEEAENIGHCEGLSQPAPPRTTPEPRRASGPTAQYSRHSSFVSLTPDSSDLSNQSSFLTTTTSPGTQSNFVASPEVNAINHEGMGQKASSIRRKHIKPEQRLNLDDFSYPPPKSIEATEEPSPVEAEPAQPLRKRPSSVQVPVPRRRSSLTALHLETSDFNRPLSQQDTLKHRASTLTSTYRQRQRSPDAITPVERVLSRDRLSPPVQSPTDTKRASVTSQQSASPLSPRLRPGMFPKTFANDAGPTSVPQPAITEIQRHCYIQHAKMRNDANKHYLTPCMTCGNVDDQVCQICTFCFLRMCKKCYAEFDGNGRVLRLPMVWRKEANAETIAKDQTQVNKPTEENQPPFHLLEKQLRKSSAQDSVKDEVGEKWTADVAKDSAVEVKGATIRAAPVVEL